ncbi:hypothetical protein BASA50_010079 [Batrachochytrium salamandrivorans]|uniref:Uncharacterized protein n=1 Tax=Batrachochytrium salamandrivorans TaxID=1357716 RepID=A0ABQ8F2E5_9FUNG|nr:hypothetical protein BASA50_010079 [Batrachochytrium salamandrivorans]
MRLSAISLSMYLIGTISASPYPAGGSGSVSESTEPVKSAFKWFRGFDTHNPKGPHDPQTQEHDNENTTTSNVGPEHDSPGFTDIFLGPDEDINTEVGSTEENGYSTSGQTQAKDHKGTTQRSSKLSGIKRKLEIPKGYLRKPKRTPQSLSTWYLSSDTDKPKEPQDTQTQEQSNENITTPNVGPEHDSSDSTGAATGSDEATNTNVHQEEKSEGSTAEQTQAEVHKGSNQRSSKLSGIKKKLKIPSKYLLKLKKASQSPSKLVESGQEVMKLLKLPNLPKLPSLNTNFQNPIQLLMPKKKKPITFKDPEEDNKVDMWDILSSQ